MNRPSNNCIECYKITDSYFIGIGFCCWNCKQKLIKKRCENMKHNQGSFLIMFEHYKEA